MRIALTGSSGLVGRRLRSDFGSAGHDLLRIVRDRRSARAGDAIFWSPASGEIDAGGLEGLDVVVHLAGESIFGIWTDSKKRRIRDSRVEGTSLLARTLARLDRPPHTLVSMSGADYYGDRGGEVVDEDSGPGAGFMAEVAVAWERAAEPAATAGIRVVYLRGGVVLSRDGGALALMLPIFRLGLGGRVGNGDQPFPWVAIDDVSGVVRHIIDHDELRGAVNMVAPGSVTLGEFVETLGRVLHRPTIFAVPAFLATLAAGDLARELLLSGARIRPRRLTESGYDFHFPKLEGALRALLQ